MKSPYIFFALMFLFAGTVYSQEPTQSEDNPGEAPEFASPGVELGVKAGLNFSNLYINGTSNDAKIGGHGGVYLEIPITSRFSVQPELMISQKGAAYVYNNTEVDARFNYFDMPVMLEFKPAGNFSFQFGPQFSYLADANLQCEKHIPEAPSLEYEICDSYNFNAFDIGMAAGVEYDIFNAYKIGVRYSHGFRPLENGEDIIVNGHQPEETGAKHSLFQVSLMMSVN